jgi:adhesin transport system membrane fusion protein
MPEAKNNGAPRKEDLDFAVSAAAVLERAPRGARMLTWGIFVFFVIFLVWAGGASIEEVVKGQGKVIPSAQIQVVQNLEGGIVRELLVREGEVVEQGQVLLRIDDTRFGSSLRENRARLLALQARAARLLAQADEEGDEFVLPEEVTAQLPQVAEQERQLFRQAKEKLAGELSILAQQVQQKQSALNELNAKAQQMRGSLGLARKELKLSRPLLAHGAISEIELLRMEREVNNLRGELKQADLSVARVESEIEEARQKLAQRTTEFRQESREQYAEVLAEMAPLQESSVALQDRVSRTAVRSPLRGTVKSLSVNTVGGVVQPGMDLVEIVPIEDSLMIEARVSPRDIAFLRPDLPAVVKLTAYDFAIYGGLDAVLVHISADTFTDEHSDEPYFLVRVRTHRNSLGEGQRPLPIMPGMTAEVDIVTGKKTILDYLLKPILRAKENALRER